MDWRGGRTRAREVGVVTAVIIAGGECTPAVVEEVLMLVMMVLAAAAEQAVMCGGGKSGSAVDRANGADTAASSSDARGDALGRECMEVQCGRRERQPSAHTRGANGVRRGF